MITALSHEYFIFYLRSTQNPPPQGTVVHDAVCTLYFLNEIKNFV